MDGLFLSTDTLNALPAHVRELIITQALKTVPAFAPSAVVAGNIEDEEDPHFAELSPGQARDFLNGCNSKTRAAIVALVQGKTPQVQVKTVAKALNEEPIALKGVWSGLTRRTRTITGDPEAYLVYWSGDQKFDANDVYSDEIGHLRELTYRSFRKALNLD